MLPVWLNNPAMLLIIAGSVIPILPYRLRMAVLLGAPAASLIWLWQIPLGTTTSMALLEYTLTPLRVDGLAFTFGVIFNVAAFLSGLYMWHTHSRLEPAAALIYAGSALGAVLAGDLVTLFMFWEVTAIASALLLVIHGLRDAMIVARRYLLVQIGSGMFLMGGDFWPVTFDLNERIKKAFDAGGINIPYPQQVVHHVHENAPEE